MYHSSKFLFKLSIANGMIGLWGAAQLNVELEQELTRVLSWWRKKMEELAPGSLLKFCNVKIRNALVRTTNCEI